MELKNFAGGNGKSRDGMNIFAKSHSTDSGASVATGLLAGLLCRI